MEEKPKDEVFEGKGKKNLTPMARWAILGCGTLVLIFIGIFVIIFVIGMNNSR